MFEGGISPVFLRQFTEIQSWTPVEWSFSGLELTTIPRWNVLTDCYLEKLLVLKMNNYWQWQYAISWVVASMNIYWFCNWFWFWVHCMLNIVLLMTASSGIH